MNENASEIDNLIGAEAIQKCQELVKHSNTCLFSTSLQDIPQTTRPMGVQEVDEDGSFWFLSSTESNKNDEIAADGRVQLYFINTSNMEFLTVYGEASITQDKERIEKYWSDIAKAWFPEGKDDPRVSVIQVKPENGFYWDTKSGKVVSLLKIAVSAVIGKTLQEGVEGSITL